MIYISVCRETQLLFTLLLKIDFLDGVGSGATEIRCMFPPMLRQVVCGEL